MSIAITRVKIGLEQDVVYARQRARLIAGVLGYDRNDQTRISTAVSEIARNALQYAGGGEVDFSLEGAPRPSCFSVTVRDSGRGIRDLEAIMEGRYASHTGLGRGIIGTRRLMDDFRIESAPGKGTVVMLKKNLPPLAPEITPAVLRRVADSLAARGSESPLEEVRVQNQELLQTLDELSHQRKELEDTNRGVLALYAELDEKVIQLQGLDRLKSEFLSNMSHEFRTPLNSILALTSLLLERTDGSLTAEQERQVSFIRKATHDLYTLVNELLDFAKIQAGKMSVAARECTVEEIFSGLRGMLKPMLTNSAIELVIEQKEEMPTLFTDDGKVSQILRNFISNALKFTVTGTISVSSHLNDQRSMVIFEVEDTGIGIAPEHLERIFSEYAQVETAQLGRPKGTGLGLPISRKLAELLGGYVEVKSTVGKGSVFSAVIPITIPGHDAGDETRSGEPHQPSAQAAGDQGGSAERRMVHFFQKPIDHEWLLDILKALERRVPVKKVLIIDDEHVVRDLFKHHLAELSVVTLEASNGTAGLELAVEARPDVIILDLVMPGMNGFEVLRLLKSTPDTRGIPVIICTSKLLDDAEKRFLHQLSMMDEEPGTVQ